MITPTARLLAVFAVASPTLALALGLGELRTHSRNDRPLEAYVDLYLSPTERTQSMATSLARDIFIDQYDTQSAVLAQIQSEVVHAVGGYSYVHLSTREVPTVSQLAFRLRVSAEDRTVARHYVINLESGLPRAVAAAVPPRQRIRSPRSTTKLNSSLPATYGPVRSGESVWSIARHFERAAPNALMKRIHELNPDAFVGGDINRLKVGVTLQLAMAETVVAAVTRNPPEKPQDIGITPDLDFSSMTTRVEMTTTAAAPTRVATVDVAQRDPALAKQLADLEVKFAAIRAKYATPSNANQAASFGTTPTAPAVALAAQPVSTVGNEAVAPLKVGSATQLPGSAPDPQPGEQTTTSATGKYSSIAPSAALFALAALGWFSWRTFRRLKRRDKSVAHISDEADLKAEVARKAENRVRMESEIRELQVKKKDRAASVETPVVEFDSTNRNLLPSDAPVQITAQDADIDASIAHGHYEQAERQLLAVIASTPRNIAAKLRLSEVYYITEEVSKFCALVEDLVSERGALSNEEWQRVSRMGKIIAPDLAIFSGPRVVGRRSSS
ncbi:MAG: hypothetical protein HYX63_15435 [Gammaproteobacteria bacterium]|nr:hypothetical protein [Gammaproteobacteria bacterium]